MFDLVDVCYALVLLQEITLGYDNPSYRLRAYFALLRIGLDNVYAAEWRNHMRPTIEVIQELERRIDVAGEVDPA